MRRRYAYDEGMRKRLQIPVALAFAISACGGDGNECSPMKGGEPCVQAPNTAETCPENTCVDSDGKCPAGCIAGSQKRYCVPDGTDAGVCPQPSVCVIAGEACPAGCTPVG
jgi:hypothetical protein